MAYSNRSPLRGEALNVYLECDGNIKPAELAKIMSEKGEAVTPVQIRKWKCIDKWEEELEKKRKQRKPGGQPGNQNAKGHGAPVDNQNAVTHGAYCKVNFSGLTEEEKQQILSIAGDTKGAMVQELIILLAKETVLRNRIENLRCENPDVFYIDKIVEMRVPKTPEDKEKEFYEKGTGKAEGEQGAEELKTAMNTVIKSSPFDHAMKLEIEWNKTHGRIIKILDSIKSYELDSARLEIERKRYRLLKQKLTGAYDIDPDTGEVNDDYEAEEEQEAEA